MFSLPGLLLFYVQTSVYLGIMHWPISAASINFSFVHFPRGNPRALAGFFLKTSFLGVGIFKLPNSSRKVFNCHSFRSLRGRRLKGMWKGVLGARGTRGSARGGREVNAFPSPLLPRAWSRALIPFPFLFERLPGRLLFSQFWILIEVYERRNFLFL